MDMVGHHRKNGDFHVGVDFRNLFHALLGVFANGGQFGNAVLLFFSSRRAIKSDGVR